MIFPVLETDKVVQVNDKFRISASKSYAVTGTPAITKVEIKPDNDTDFIDVFIVDGQWYLDFQYQTVGEKVITLRVTVGAEETEDFREITETIMVLSEIDDYLFSEDQDLKSIESDILRYLPDGRSSYKYAHREAQRQILEWLYINGFRKWGDLRIEKADFIDIEEVRYWSKFLTFAIICFDLKKQQDDIWHQKANRALSEAMKYQNMVKLRFDYNGDGVLSKGEGKNLGSYEWRRV